MTALSDQAPELGKLWPNSFGFLGTMTGAAKGFVETITKLRSKGKIYGRDAQRGQSVRYRACEGGAQSAQEKWF